MTSRPILFSAPMVRAILAGTKTQTRRVIGLPDGEHPWRFEGFFEKKEAVFARANRIVMGHEVVTEHMARKLYAHPGDTLWVRETFANMEYRCNPPTWTYRADTPSTDAEGWALPAGVRWRPSIHMPRAASRITLRVTSVRVERLQEMSAEDALAEGIAHRGAPLLGFEQLWDSLNAARAPWASNPWVWVIAFTRVEV